LSTRGGGGQEKKKRKKHFLSPEIANSRDLRRVHFLTNTQKNNFGQIELTVSTVHTLSENMEVAFS
jgi:hypothetical protein